MANDRMWLVNDRLQCRLLIAKHNGESWCLASPNVDMPCDSTEPTGWRLVYECDAWASYTNLATEDGTDGNTPRLTR